MNSIATLAPATAGWLADAILLLHVLVVVAVVGGQALIMIGAARGWRWIRHYPLRVAHLGCMLFIAMQSWMGALCPLTVWEQALRAQAGAASYSEGFIEYWLGRLLYIEAPWWVFVAAYTAFAALVAATWWWAPPRRSGSATSVRSEQAVKKTRA